MLALPATATGDDCGDHAAARYAGPLEIVPFKAWHLEWLNLQQSQAFLSPLLTRQYGQALEAAGWCFSAFAGKNVIACAGVVWFWEGRAQVWSLMSDEMPKYRKSVHKAVKHFLRDYRI